MYALSYAHGNINILTNKITLQLLALFFNPIWLQLVAEFLHQHHIDMSEVLATANTFVSQKKSERGKGRGNN